jgi:kynureninase
LDESWLKQEIFPRFSRVLARDEIYLANHSLGRPPDRMGEDVRAALDAWYRDMDAAWATWIEGRERFRALTGKLVGVAKNLVIPKTSAGQGLRAVLNSFTRKPRVVTSDGEFDSLDFILRVYREQGRIELKIVPWRALDPRGADLVVLSSVMFRTGEVVTDLAQRIHDAHTAGALVLLDVYHHAGVMPLDLAGLKADFAVGGSYKYTRGGPGACWLYVRPGLVETLRTPDTGWFAKKDMFTYARPEPPEFGPGGDAWLESTPPVLASIQAIAGLELTLELGVERIREHNLEQKQLLASLIPNAQGAGTDHGAFVTLKHPGAEVIASKLRERKVKADARGDYLRLCPDILNTRAELEAAALKTIGTIG